MQEALPKAAWFARNVGRPERALFTSDELALLEPYLTAVAKSPDEVLFEEGDVADGVWIVREGRIALEVNGSLIRVLASGECVGDPQILTGGPFPYRVRVLEESTFFYLSEESFLEVMEKMPVVARRWTAKLSAQLIRTQLRVRELLGRSLSEQVAQLLVNEAEDHLFPHSQETFAAMLGSHRSPLNRVLKKLERRGLVRLGYRMIEILDAEGCRRLANASEVDTDGNGRANK